VSTPLVCAAFLLVALVTAASPAAASDSLAPTPPMGWNSWNRFHCDVNEQVVRDAADAMVASGMRDAGYQYVVVDDCWQGERDRDGRIAPDPVRFPSGMRALADHVHSRGLKFGLYSDAGTFTCATRPGSKDHEAQDAKTYAEWGVDYLKYDWCHTEGQDARASYALMSRALRATGRPIVFSICEWGSTRPWTWAAGIGHLWRATGDIQDCWDCGREWGGMGITHVLDLVADLHPFAGPGRWNDPDMLEVGNGGLTLAESRSHFSLWALLAAPLMAGNDLATMKPEVRDILLNREVIAVDQDPLGVQGRRILDGGHNEVWMKPLADGSRAVVLFNRGSDTMAIRCGLEDLGLSRTQKVTVRDLWAKKDVSLEYGSVEGKVKPHDVVMLRVTPVD
jgi:alpha-galactosidase